MLSILPAGFYSVFREMSEFLLRAIQAGLRIDERTVPDISVGKMWSAYWEAQGYDARYGARFKAPHNYPDYYPQAASNPQDIWVYPVESLGAFRTWLDTQYLPNSFPTYLGGKVQRKTLARAEADRLLAAVLPPSLDEGDGD
jgi:hypothetical protein